MGVDTICSVGGVPRASGGAGFQYYSPIVHERPVEEEGVEEEGNLLP